MGAAFMLAPILAIFVVFVGYGVLFSYGLEGREVGGTIQKVSFTGCAEAMPVVQARVDQMGLADAILTANNHGFSFSALIPDVVEFPIPQTLATPGILTVLDEDDNVILTNADLAEATVYLGLRAQPRTLLTFTYDGGVALAESMIGNSGGSTRVMVDGEQHLHLKNLPSVANGQLELELTGQPDRQVIAYAAHWAIALANGPLPCELTVVAEPLP